MATRTFFAVEPADGGVGATGLLPLLQCVGERLPWLEGHRRLQPDRRGIAAHLRRPLQDELVVSAGVRAVAVTQSIPSPMRAQRSIWTLLNPPNQIGTGRASRGLMPARSIRCRSVWTSRIFSVQRRRRSCTCSSCMRPCCRNWSHQEPHTRRSSSRCRHRAGAGGSRAGRSPPSAWRRARSGAAAAPSRWCRTRSATSPWPRRRRASTVRGIRSPRRRHPRPGTAGYG